MFATWCYGSTALAIMRCLSVCVSVTFVNCVQTNKHIFNIFSLPGSQPHHSSFCAPNVMAIFRRRHSNWGVKYTWGRQISIVSLYLASLRTVNTAAGQVLSTWWRRTTVPQVVTLIAGSKWQSLLMAGDDDKKSQRYAEDSRTVHLIARSDKSVAYVTNNNWVCLTFCTTEANYWQTQSIVWLLCNNRVTCY